MRYYIISAPTPDGIYYLHSGRDGKYYLINGGYGNIFLGQIKTYVPMYFINKVEVMDIKDKMLNYISTGEIRDRVCIEGNNQLLLGVIDEEEFALITAGEKLRGSI
jgi:hypothetical protein